MKYSDLIIKWAYAHPILFTAVGITLIGAGIATEKVIGTVVGKAIDNGMCFAVSNEKISVSLNPQHPQFMPTEYQLFSEHEVSGNTHVQSE